MPGARITHVRGQPFTAARLAAAVAEKAASGIALTADIEQRAETMVIHYDGGLRYPVLTHIAGRPDRLLPLLAPR